MAGKKGRSGRKSLKQEMADLKKLHEMYFNVQSQEAIETKIRKGKFSVRDRHILNGLEGDQNAINSIFKKIYPDNLDLTSDGKPLLIGLADNDGEE